jgi:signal transduction histidine kinase
MAADQPDRQPERQPVRPALPVLPAGGRGDEDARVLQRVAQAVVSSLELEPMLREVATACLGAAGAECCTIELWRRATDEVEVVAGAFRPGWSDAHAFPGERGSLAGYGSWRLALEGRVVRREADDPELEPAERSDLDAWQVGALLLVPLVVRDRCAGVMELYSRDRGAFPPDRVDLCQTLARYAGIGIERSDAYARERKLALRLAAVAKAAVEAASQLDPDRLLDDLPGLIVGAFGHYLANVFLLDRGDGSLVLRAIAGYPGPDPAPMGDRMPPGAGICGRVARTGEVYLAPDVLTDPHYVQGPLLTGTRSELAAPIVARQGVIGVLDVQSREPDAFDDADAVALRALAAAVGIAIENARLFRRIRDDEHRLRAIMEAVPSPLGVYDGSGRLTFANRALLGVPELVEAGAGERSAEPDAPATLAAAPDAAASPPDADAPDEIRLDEPPRTYLRRLTPFAIAGDEGDAGARVVLYQDVTVERAAVRAKDQLLSIAAHELRTPLTALLGYLDLLLAQTARQLPALEPIHARLEKVRQEGGQIAWLIEQLLDLARAEAGTIPLRPMEVLAGDVLVRLAERFAVVEDGAERVRLALPPEPVACRWDEERIVQILSNLLANALKYAPDETPVVLALVPPADERVRIEIRDRGPGIAREDLARLFQPFSRAGPGSTVGGGLGLGLYVSRLLSERLGGRLWLESAPGEGTVAVLELPVAPPDPTS